MSESLNRLDCVQLALSAVCVCVDILQNHSENLEPCEPFSTWALCFQLFQVFVRTNAIAAIGNRCFASLAYGK